VLISSKDYFLYCCLSLVSLVTRLSRVP